MSLTTLNKKVPLLCKEYKLEFFIDVEGNNVLINNTFSPRKTHRMIISCLRWVVINLDIHRNILRDIRQRALKNLYNLTECEGIFKRLVYLPQEQIFRASADELSMD